MRPLKLHLKTALVVSTIGVALFSILAFFFIRQIVAAEHQQYAERAKQIATYYADRLAKHNSQAATFLDATDESQAKLVESYGFQVNAIQIYQFTRDDLTSETSAFTTFVQPTESERPLARTEIDSLLGRGFPEPDVDVHAEGKFSVRALAPIIFVDQRRGVEKVAGAVAIQVEVPPAMSLAGKMARYTVFVLVLLVLSIALTTYMIFKRLVYDPVDALLSGMARAERGDLSISVPPRAEDEIGLLTTRFNTMVGRLRELGEERAAHARQLEERVREATSDLAESNDQLVRKNIELFGIQRQLGQLERLAAAGQLAAQFAHEVGTPLNLISGHVQLLRAKETDERTIKRLETIAAQISRIERIVRSMLDQTRRPTARLEPVDLGALLGRLFDTIAPTLAAKRVELVDHIEPDLPEPLADPDQLQQVLINLVNNSLDAMPNGGELRVSAHAGDDGVVVELADTGTGIAEADLPHLFEPLFTTKARGQGTGFGLAVAQEIVREHGGRIEALSEAGGGAAFTIFLPKPADAGPPAEADAADAASEEPAAADQGT